MTYATVESVRQWLMITTTSEDAEISQILEEVHAQILEILKFYVAEPPSTDTTLAHIEAMWAAGIYRMRREPKNEPHVFVKTAQELLNNYILLKYKKRLVKI